MMEKSFCFGLMLGAIGGALIVSNSQKARQLLKKSQDEIKQKVNNFVEDKLEETSETIDKAQSKIKKG